MREHAPDPLAKSVIERVEDVEDLVEEHAGVGLHVVKIGGEEVLVQEPVLERAPERLEQEALVLRVEEHRA
jgi:hypothetical protein